MSEYPSEMPEEPTGELAIVKVGILRKGIAHILGDYIYLVRSEGRWFNSRFAGTEFVWEGFPCIVEMGLTTYPLVLSEGTKR